MEPKKVFLSFAVVFGILFSHVAYLGTHNIIYYLLARGIAILTTFIFGIELLFKNNVYLIAGMDLENSKKPEVRREYRLVTLPAGFLCFLICIFLILETHKYLKVINFFENFNF